jgi:hypothetical protein
LRAKDQNLSGNCGQNVWDWKALNVMKLYSHNWPCLSFVRTVWFVSLLWTNCLSWKALKAMKSKIHTIVIVIAPYNYNYNCNCNCPLSVNCGRNWLIKSNLY